LVILGFLIATAVGLTTVLVAGRRGTVERSDYPWALDEVSKLHVAIVGSLAGFAFTGVVLVVTLARDIGQSAQVALDTVILMFLVAYLYWIGGAFLISYLPGRLARSDLVQRVHFSLASNLEFRVVFLSWFALLPLLQANGLGRLLQILCFLLPASLFLGSLLLAMAADGLGVVRFKETYFSAAVATGLALAYGAAVAWLIPGARTPYSALHVTVVMFCVNGLGFALAVLTPLASRYVGVDRFYERYGRRIVIADMQLTMLSLAFLWLAVVGAI
jgi:hypothetical protein